MAALTLMRLSEVRTLRREMLHLEQGVVLLPQTKTEPRPVILSAAAQKIFRTHLGGVPAASPWVFPAPHGGPFSRERIALVFRKATRAPGCATFTSTTCATTAPPWPSIAASVRPL